MRVDTCQSLHFGVNYFVAPVPNVDGTQMRKFLQEIAEEGIEFDRTSKGAAQLQFARGTDAPLEVKVAQAGPQVGQLVIIAPHPRRLLSLFIEEAQAICEAFRHVWPGKFQIVSRDCTIRRLYESEGDHAFEFLWERRLRQPAEQLKVFGRLVLGGGLRFVMPPEGTEDDPVQTEVKVESYLRDSKKIFVEVQFAWPQPGDPSNLMEPGTMLTAVESFADEQVVAFILGDIQ